MLKGLQVFKALELSVGATLQLLGISRSAALLCFVWSIPPEVFCPHVVRYSLCRKAFHPGGQHAGIPAVCHDAEDLFFSSASSFSCLFCFQFRFVMTFLLWETALTFRYICFHVIEALASVVFTLLVDRMPSEVSAYPILDFSNLLIGFVIAKLHVGSWHTARADYPALITVCIHPPVRWGFGAATVLQNLRGDELCKNQDTQFQNTLWEEGMACLCSLVRFLPPVPCQKLPACVPLPQEVCWWVWVSRRTGTLLVPALVKCTAEGTQKADFSKENNMQKGKNDCINWKHVGVQSKDSKGK